MLKDAYYQAGDKVRIVGNLNGHGLAIGIVATIEAVYLAGESLEYYKVAGARIDARECRLVERKKGKPFAEKQTD